MIIVIATFRWFDGRLESRGMKSRKLLYGFMAIVGAVAGTAIASPAFAADSGPWEVQTFGKCLEVQGGSTANSAQIQNWTCPSATGKIAPLHQRWIWRNLGNGYFRLINGKSGKCANVKGNSQETSAKIIQYPCGGSTTYNDQWRMVLELKNHNGHDYYKIVSRSSEFCLGVQDNSVANGADIIQRSCHSGAALITWVPAKQA
ncbi:RICIN domain-containing protein [Actinoplanes regularis]|uniref:RICIN domain-containing protein n=1 Tax=Actinoplanes regularis TaxID=52697 RepID=UPI0025532DBD|nr:RICIN domain-containing protein [Actinoplanes regularis]